MKITAQHISLFTLTLLVVVTELGSYATDKQLKRSREEAEILKEQVSLLLQQITTE